MRRFFWFKGVGAIKVRRPVGVVTSVERALRIWGARKVSMCGVILRFLRSCCCRCRRQLRAILQGTGRTAVAGSQSLELFVKFCLQFIQLCFKTVQVRRNKGKFGNNFPKFLVKGIQLFDGHN